MRGVLFISFMALGLISLCQRDYTNYLKDHNFQIPGLDPDLTPNWDISDTILLLEGYNRGSITFNKKGKLLMQQGYSQCGNITFREGVKFLISKKRRYNESIIGIYNYDAKEQLLVLNFGEKTYNYKIIRSCYGRYDSYGLELFLLSISK